MLKASPVYADYLATLAKNHTLPVAGIILGMTRSHRSDTIVHMCRLFKAEEDREAGEEGGGVQKIDEEERKDTLVFDVEDILNMLTPGIAVLGTFVVCKSDDVVKDAAAWDRVKLIYRVIRKLCADASKHYLLVHNSTAGKTSCKLVVGDKANLDKNELKPVIVDFSDRDAYKLVQLNAQFSMTRSHFLRSYDLVAAAGEASAQMKASRLKELLCVELEKTLNSALITFNGEIPAANQKIQDVVANQTEAGGDRAKVAPIVAEIYEKNVPIAEDEEVKRSSNLLQLEGCVASRLFVYPDDTLDYVEALLRKDLIQSITQRVQRATESESANKEEVVAIGELCERMGRRIYFTIQPSNIQLFDYLYPDESEDELRERINHKLDIDVEVTDIYFDLEDGQGLSRSGNFIETIEQTVADGTKAAASQITSQLGNRKMLFLFIRFVLIAVAAIIIPLVFNSKRDSK